MRPLNTKYTVAYIDPIHRQHRTKIISKEFEKEFDGSGSLLHARLVIRYDISNEGLESAPMEVKLVLYRFEVPTREWYARLGLHPGKRHVKLQASKGPVSGLFNRELFTA